MFCRHVEMCGVCAVSSKEHKCAIDTVYKRASVARSVGFSSTPTSDTDSVQTAAKKDNGRLYYISSVLHILHTIERPCLLNLLTVITSFKNEIEIVNGQYSSQYSNVCDLSCTISYL